MSRQKLSVVLITKNESELISDCLKSVNWADEIIVLDAGSTDNTCQMAQAQGAIVHQSQQAWPGFGIQRQRAQHYATGDMILMIDADERVTPQLQLSIEEILQQPKQINTIYSIKRSNWFLGRFMRHSGWYPDPVTRLYPRHFTWHSHLVHESLNTENATIETIKGDLLHLTCRDLHRFQQKQLAYAEAWARQRFNNGQTCSLGAVYGHTLAAWLKTLIVRGGILDGKQGCILAMVNAQYTFNKYAMLWALSRTA